VRGFSLEVLQTTFPLNNFLIIPTYDLNEIVLGVIVMVRTSYTGRRMWQERYLPTDDF